MTVVDHEVRLYWLTGCGNCTRLKGYLKARGVDFTSIDVLNDEGAQKDMAERGITSMPVVSRGDRWVAGFDLAQVDDLLDLTHDPAGRRLEVEELVVRAARLLELAAGAAEKLPADHHDDPTPTTELQGGEAFLFLRDGTPHVPHATSKQLVHHIAGHGEKFRRLALCADGVHQHSFSLGFDGDHATFGEPIDGAPMFLVVEQLELTAHDLRAWWQVKPPVDFERVLETHYGPQTIHQLLQTHVCSMAQHTNQLVDVLERLGIETEAPGPDDLEGLQMPDTVWGN